MTGTVNLITEYWEEVGVSGSAGLCSCVPRAHVCPALMCVTRPVRLKLCTVNHSRWWWW